jgi:type I restriction enzyme S subunit
MPVPPLSEQRRIAEILDCADALRRKRCEADAKAARILPALFCKIFGDPAGNPKGLLSERLNEVTSVIHRYPTFYGAEYVSDGVAVVRISDIREDHILNKDIKAYVKVPNELSERFPRTLLEPFDIVMAVRGDTTGKIGLVPQELAGANISPNLIRISANKDRVRPLYLFCYLLIARTALGHFITNTAKKSITAKNLKAIPVLVPSMDEQKQFEKMMNYVLNNGEDRARIQTGIEYLFRLLLHRSFTGDLTAQWRQARMEELLAEMKEQAKAPNIDFNIH